MSPAREIAPAKLNLALHVRSKLSDGRHSIETIFSFCTDGDRLSAEPADELSLQLSGPFAAELGNSEDNLVVIIAAVAVGCLGLAVGTEDWSIVHNIIGVPSNFRSTEPVGL